MYRSIIYVLCSDFFPLGTKSPTERARIFSGMSSMGPQGNYTGKLENYTSKEFVMSSGGGWGVRGR